MSTTYLEAIREGIWEEMERDPNVFCIGEDIGEYGGAFKVTEGFVGRFGEERVIDTPISETGLVPAKSLILMVPRGGIEPPTLRFSVTLVLVRNRFKPDQTNH